MADQQKRVERPEKYSNGKEDSDKKVQKESGILVL